MPAVNRRKAVALVDDYLCGGMSTQSDDDAETRRERRMAEELEDGSLDPDELDAEPAWWDEGSDDET